MKISDDGKKAIYILLFNVVFWTVIYLIAMLYSRT